MARPPRVVIVADDLTGAMDVAGPLAVRGLHTCAVATVSGCTPEQLQGAEVLSINAESRHLDPAPAAQRVANILRQLVHPEAEILIKKIDSTLRGNVVAETLSMLEASGRWAAVVAPAFPAQNRTVRGGIVHVDGVPLEHTTFARDALSAPPLEPLTVVFERAAPGLRTQLIQPDHPLPSFDGVQRLVVIVDSTTDEDLRSLVRGLRDRLPHVLLVGSAGLAQAVAEVYFDTAPTQVAPPKATGRLLFVVGSRTQQSAQQVSALLETGGAQMFAAPNGRLDEQAVAHATAPVLIIKSTPDAQGREGDAARVATALADAVSKVLESGTIGALVVTGGDTAAAILQRLSQPVLRVMGTVLPGIPYSRIHAARADIWFVTKAGGFGGRDTFVTIAQRLKGDERSG